MKNVLLSLVFFFVVHISYGQYAVYFSFTFDSGQISSQRWWPDFTPNYFNDSSWIYIDTVHHPHNQWQVGRPRKLVFDSAYSYPNAIVTDTLHPCLPSDTSSFILKVPKNAWDGLLDLSFRYKLNIDTGDIAKIEWSEDTGSHWTNALTDSNGLFSFAGTIPSLTASTTGWKTMNLYPSYSAWQTAPIDTFLIRFTLITDSDTVSRDGWMIDNIIMGYWGESVPIVLMNNDIIFYPNPASEELTITATYNITSIAINNILGHTVLRNSYYDKQVNIDVADLPAGIYFVKINCSEVRKFIKE